MRTLPLTLLAFSLLLSLLPSSSPSPLPPPSLSLSLSLSPVPHGRHLLWNILGVDSRIIVEPIVALVQDGRQIQPTIEEAVAQAEHLNKTTLARRQRTPMLMAIFTAPLPFVGKANDSQRRAILSWLKLRPTPRVILFGNHPSFYEMANEFSRVSVEPRVDCNHHGVPLVNSMVARAQAARHPFSMIISPDVVLLGSHIAALRLAFKNFPSFVMMGAQREVGRFPAELLDLEDMKTKKPLNEDAIKDYVKKHQKETGMKIGFFVWNNSPVPLHNASMPPFAFQRGRHDQWFAHQIATAGFRALVDASELVYCIRVRIKKAGQPEEVDDSIDVNDPEEGVKGSIPQAAVYAYQGPTMPEGEANITGERRLIRLQRWNNRRPTFVELLTNRQMAEIHAIETAEGNLPMEVAPWRATRCTVRSRRVFCVKQVKCVLSSHRTRGLSDDSDPDSRWLCNHVALQTLPQSLQSIHSKFAPHYVKLADLLPEVTDVRKVVTLIAVSSLYKDMLMSFICMLRRLELPNPLVAALDQELYQFGLEQGLAVFYDEAALSITQEHARNGSACKFGTPCFKNLTKLKSRTVLQVLHLGYSVLWSDVDIVWFRDPLPELLAYGPGVFPVQSDQPYRKMKPNGANGTSIIGGAINSGFYFARSEPKVIEAFEAIVAHAKTTNTSEQPSFYRILCGVDGEYTVGNEECRWPKNGLRIVFLPRSLHPNGKVYFYWFAKRTAYVCVSKGCATLHNNWIKGKQMKINRMREKGLWYYDPNNRLCIHTWYRFTQGLPLFQTNTDEEVETQDLAATDPSLTPAT